MSVIYPRRLKWKTLTIALLCAISSTFLSNVNRNSKLHLPVSNSAVLWNFDALPLRIFENNIVRTHTGIITFLIITILGYFFISRYENLGRIKLIEISTLLCALALVISNQHSSFSIAILIFSCQKLGSIVELNLKSFTALLIALLCAPATTFMVLLMGHVIPNLSHMYKQALSWLLRTAITFTVLQHLNPNQRIEGILFLALLFLTFGFIYRKSAMHATVKIVLGESDKESLHRLSMIYAYLATWLVLGSFADLHLLTTIFGIHLVAFNVKNRSDYVFLGIKLLALPVAAIIFKISGSSYGGYGALVCLFSLIFDLIWLSSSESKTSILKSFDVFPIRKSS